MYIITIYKKDRKIDRKKIDRKIDRRQIDILFNVRYKDRQRYYPVLNRMIERGFQF